MAAKIETKWIKVSKQVMVGEFATVIKRHKDDGRYGLSLDNGESKPWLTIGEELGVQGLDDAIAAEERKAARAMALAKELRILRDDLAALVEKEGIRLAPPAPVAVVNPEACLQAARMMHSVKGVLPPATDPKVMQTAHAMAQAAQAAITSEAVAK